jgi:hypothetical protein
MQFKLFPHMSGVWEGTYTRIAADGAVMFKHKSRLTLKLEGNSWWQTNYYEFDNGRVEFHNFGLSLFNEQGVMQYDNPRIVGEAWEANGGKNILLWWSYKQEPGTMLYEMITPVSHTHRTRVWQHTRNGVFEGLTMIEEWKKADQETIAAGHYEQKSYVKEA